MIAFAHLLTKSGWDSEPITESSRIMMEQGGQRRQIEIERERERENKQKTYTLHLKSEMGCRRDVAIRVHRHAALIACLDAIVCFASCSSCRCSEHRSLRNNECACCWYELQWFQLHTRILIIAETCWWKHESSSLAQAILGADEWDLPFPQ